MRSSYYSDRRFKRSSLAHELCSKIEVTPGPGSRSYRELPSNPSLPLSLSRSPPLPSFYPVNAPWPPSRRSNAIKPPLLSPCFCFDDIFSVRIGRDRSVGGSSYEQRSSSSISLPSTLETVSPLPFPPSPSRPESLSSGIRRL